jgi:integrase
MIQTQQYRYFIDSLASEATKKTYAAHLEQFCRYFKIDDCARLVGLHPSLVEAQIIEYIVHLKNKGNAFSSIKVSLAAILHFYLMNDDITLNRKKISRFLGKESMKIQSGKSYTREQIAKMLTVCDERTRALILLLASTGVRIGAIPGLKFEHFQPYTSCPDCYQISVYDGEYITFCTPESMRAVDDYLAYRVRCGEKLNPNSPIIREQFERNDLLKVRNPRPISLLTIRSLIYETLLKAGITQRDHLIEGQRHARKEIPLAHGFRRFFNTALMNADVHPSFKKLLMGHNVQLDEVYYDKGSEKSRAKLLEEYSKAIHALTINPTEEENERLKNQITKMEHESQEWKEIKQMVFDMKNSMELKK